jgi:hypothetical protein
VDAGADASQRAGDGVEDGLQSQGEFGFYGYASQGSQMDFDFKEGPVHLYFCLRNPVSTCDAKQGSQTSEWAHGMPDHGEDADGITGATARHCAVPRDGQLASLGDVLPSF